MWPTTDTGRVDLSTTHYDAYGFPGATRSCCVPCSAASRAPSTEFFHETAAHQIERSTS